MGIGGFGGSHVSKKRPCPICGKDDWCGFIDCGNTELVMCMRRHDESNVYGVDGNEYVFIKKTKRGEGTIYKNRVDYERDLQEWKKENGYSQNTRKLSFEKKMETVQKEEMPDNCVELLPADRIDAISREMLSMLVLEPRHREYLLRQGWTDELIERHHVKSFPESDFIRWKYSDRMRLRNPRRRDICKALELKFGTGSLKGYPGAFLDSKGIRNLAGPSGIVFPMYDLSGRIVRLRIRMDFTDILRDLKFRDGKVYFDYETDSYEVTMKGVFKTTGGTRELMKDDTAGRKGKYRTLSSGGGDRSDSKTVVTECGRSLNEPSVYMTEGDDPMLCYIVEGEPKSIYSNYRLKAPVISVPGVNSWFTVFDHGLIEGMRQKGTKMFVVAYDADKNSNENVLYHEGELVDALKKANVPVAIADWDEELGKGLDDLLSGGNSPLFRIV